MPWLVAIFNEDLALPIATFQSRANGQCSYMQMGQEIKEDNMVVTPNSPRAAYVESIRMLLEGSRKGDFVEELIAQEIDNYRDHIEAASGPTVSRLAEKYFESTDLGTVRAEKIRVLNGEIPPESLPDKDFLIKKITYVSEDDTFDTLNGRAVTLVLAREVDSDAKRPRRHLLRRNSNVPLPATKGNLQLTAVARGGVALKLLEFSPKGVTTENGLDFVTDQRTLSLLMQVLSPSAESERQELAKIKIQVLRAKGNYVSISRDGIVERNSAHYGSRVWVESWKGVKATILNQANSMDRGKISFLDTIKLFEKLIADNGNDQLGELYARLRISAKLDTLLGKNDSGEEQLITKLGALVADDQIEFAGVLKDKKAGKTRTNVDATVRIRNTNRRIDVQITGRPIALQGFEKTTFFDETLYMDRPNKIPEDKVKEIVGIIGAICLDKNKTTPR